MSSLRYDEDARLPASVSDTDSNSESECDVPDEPKKFKDEDVLKDHDEAERLLTEHQVNQKKATSATKRWPYTGYNGGEKVGSTRGRKKSKANKATSNPVYKMEEGVKDSSANTSSDSLVAHNDQWEKQSKIQSWLKYMFILAFIIIFFGLLLYGAHRASLSAHLSSPPTQWNNGTHNFMATTILISLDGFRADFLQQKLTPSLSAFVKSGISPQFMLPSFPSVTFPNHYTLVTGLYPESHGIVSNQFWDPEFEEEFYYTNTTSSMQPKWWSNAEPIWVTAEKQGVKTAIHMWPGSEAHVLGIEPTYLDKFNAFETLPSKVDRILQWLDMPSEERPQLIASYVPDVDRDGHAFGPNSTEIRATIAEADNMLTLLIEGVLERNLTEIVNIVIVSDHGMATMSVNRMVQLDDLIDMTLVDHIDGWPLRGVRLKDPDRDLDVVYQQLMQASQEASTFDVYTLKTMPERYHFTKNPRIAPLWIVPKTGWLVIEKESFDIAAALEAGKEFNPRGAHGFDHEHPLMRAIFIARGPAFPHVGNSRLAPFQNIEVYNIVCDSLGIQPHANNGTIRLPLTPEGLHSEMDTSIEEPNDDPADINQPNQPTTSLASGDTEDGIEEDIPDGSTSNQNADTSKGNWWKYLHDQLDKAKEWAEEFIESIRNNTAKQPPHENKISQRASVPLEPI